MQTQSVRITSVMIEAARKVAECREHQMKRAIKRELKHASYRANEQRQVRAAITSAAA